MQTNGDKDLFWHATMKEQMACHGDITNGVLLQWCTKTKMQKKSLIGGEDSVLKCFFTSLSLHIHFESGNFAMTTKLCWWHLLSQGENNHNYMKHVIYQSPNQQSTLAL